MARAKYLSRYESDEYGEHFVFFEYEYRGYKYTIYENRSKGNEPLSWQHKNEQAQIDKLIEIEECEKEHENKPHKTVDKALKELFEQWA